MAKYGITVAELYEWARDNDKLNSIICVNTKPITVYDNDEGEYEVSAISYKIDEQSEILYIAHERVPAVWIVCDEPELEPIGR